MKLWQNVIHQLYDFSRLIGLRDRLRCPECKAVGTYKPHGGWLDFKDRRQTFLLHGVYVARKKRRWMCKWCGAYDGPETDMACAYPNMVEGCWTRGTQSGTVNQLMRQHQEHYRGQVAYMDTLPDRAPSEIHILDRWIPWPWEG